MSEEREVAARGLHDGDASIDAAAAPSAGASPADAGSVAPAETGLATPVDPGSATPADTDLTTPADTGAVTPADTGSAAAPTGRAPTLLPPNPVFRFYEGGAGIDAFRGVTPGSGPGAPEDWVGSTTTSFGDGSEGLASLSDGRVLRDAIAADPAAFLGAEHVGRLGSNPGLLVKLLDAGERLAVHFHPGREFAAEHLHSDFGKTEAWLILAAEPGAHMHLGLRDTIDLQTLRRWVTDQDSDEMLQALNKVPVKAGDALFVPAGTLHTIGSGITLIELQEPSDMSVVIEWRHAGVSTGEANLQLGWDTILPAAELEAGVPIHIPAQPAPAGAGASHLTSLLPSEADPYFRAQLLTVAASDPFGLDPQFAILIGTGGELTLTSGDDAHEPLTIVRGQTAFIPYAAGSTTVSGSGTAIRCLPPSTAPASSEGTGA